MIWFSSLARPVALIALGMCCGLSPAAAEPSVKDVLKTYADIAQAGYADLLATAKTMRLAIDQFLSRPTEQNSDRRPRRLGRRAHSLHADRGLSLRQFHRR